MALPPTGVYGAGMDQYIRDEAELGERAAAWLDDEQADPRGWVADHHYREEFRARQESPVPEIGPMTESDDMAWGGQRPSGSYEEWAREGQQNPGMAAQEMARAVEIRELAEIHAAEREAGEKEAGE